VRELALVLLAVDAHMLAGRRAAGSGRRRRAQRARGILSTTGWPLPP